MDRPAVSRDLDGKGGVYLEDCPWCLTRGVRPTA